MTTQTYGMILTSAGAAKVAAALSGGPQVQLTQLAVGDSSGTGYNPVGTETGLVHETARVTLDSVIQDPQNPPWARVRGTLPANIGGFFIREIGIYDAGGTLFAIGRYPDTYKPVITEGAAFDAPITVILEIGSASAVTLTVDPSNVLASQLFVFANDFYFAVKSATLLVPPPSPSINDLYLLPATGTSGLWAGQGGKIALYRGSVSGWYFINPPLGAKARTADTSLEYVRIPTGWRGLMATLNEAMAGTDGTLVISPPTLIGVVNHKASEDRLAFFGSI